MQIRVLFQERDRNCDFDPLFCFYFSASKKDKGRLKARVKVFLPFRVRKRDVSVTFPNNK